ncbi:unnamed protein product [Haemonchus placei]|uniref:Uncharacterized protein n=1 Tax=Haemonchus placei TaxID=6290 RepID=A0A0N4WAL9_HAEPC|nr:unnamed protein product [Haemonchus placei]
MWKSVSRRRERPAEVSPHRWLLGRASVVIPMENVTNFADD